MRASQGSPFPLGATWDGEGTNFALYSGVAERVELCLFGGDGPAQAAPETRVELTEADGFVWHGYLPAIGPGQRYGYRVHGPFDPASGVRCNPAKLLLDPYAKAVEGGVRWAGAVFGHRASDPSSPSMSDSAPFVPRSVVTSTDFDWGDDRPPGTAPADTVIYEAHVRGLTLGHPRVPGRLRGSYAALGHPEITAHLRRLGITALELLPVHQHVPEQAVAARGLANHWGYNTIGFFSPDSRYAVAGQRGGQVREFKGMVRALHAAGIEVILDVVYNHTAEAGHGGPTLCFRGIDNAAYYRLREDDPRFYVNDTGCGNSFNVRHPRALQLIMDSLRYWILDMHVDGFRFDLAPALAREHRDFDPLAAFLRLVLQDPVVSRVKLIAEPWDLGQGGYQLGCFPAPWSEWNGQYAGTVRDFWRGRPALAGLASGLTGSSNEFQAGGRRPWASVNYVTCHDGFTLTDLVSYDRKHNEANGEAGLDGTDDNRSWNCGTEGPTTDPAVTGLRDRQRRNFLVTLLCSQGTPMLLAGDEFGRTQEGNNNAYCQDNELSWLDWEMAGRERHLTDFVAALVALRRQHRVFRSSAFFRGQPPAGHPDGPADVAWLTPAGHAMTERDWRGHGSHGGSLAVYLNGAASGATGDASFLLLFNAQDGPVTFTLPAASFGAEWEVLVDTAAEPSARAAAAGVRDTAARREDTAGVPDTAGARDTAAAAPAAAAGARDTAAAAPAAAAGARDTAAGAPMQALAVLGAGDKVEAAARSVIVMRAQGHAYT